MSKAYLDTSAARSLGGWLDEHAAKTRTSALAVVELVNAALASKSQFGAARSALRRILVGNISVAWELPDSLMARAFDWVIERCSIEERRIGSLQAVARCIVASETIEDASAALASKGVAFGLDYWASYDDEFGRGYVEQTIAGHAQVKAAFEQAKTDEAGQIPMAALANGFTAFCVWFATEFRDVNISATVLALATRMANSVDPHASSDQLIGEIYESYNGSIDVFVKAFSWCSITDHRDTRRPARNDALDLAHLLYLSQEDTLVAGDAHLLKVADVVGVTVLSPAEFRDRRT